MSSPLAILGAGNMASALALRLMRHRRPVRLYCIEPDVESSINLQHTNQKYLPGHLFQSHVSASSSVAETVQDADVIFLAVPSFAVHEVMKSTLPHLAKHAIIASLTKGLDPNTFQPLILQEGSLLSPAQRRRLVSLGGPAVANEIAQGTPTGLVAASKDDEAAHQIKNLLENDSIKIECSRDIKGVALASALKNPYAIALGMCDGLKLSTNAKSLVLTIALQEMAKLLRASRADANTVYGLAGIGDLVVTGFSPHGRNRTYGERLVTAASRDPQTLGLTTVEGISAAPLALNLAQESKTEVPLLHSILACLHARKDFSQPFVHFLKTFAFADL